VAILHKKRCHLLLSLLKFWSPDAADGANSQEAAEAAEAAELLVVKPLCKNKFTVFKIAIKIKVKSTLK